MRIWRIQLSVSVFQLSSTKGATTIVSNIKADSVKAGLIKVQDKNSLAEKLAKYVPYWA